MKNGGKQIFSVRHAFSNPHIYPGIPAITSGINSACVMNVWGTVCPSLEPLLYCPFTSSLLFITVLVSELLAALRPTGFIWPARLSSAPVSLSVSLFPPLVLCQFQLVWQIRSRGCHGNLSFSPLLDRSSPGCIPSFTTPQKCTPPTCTAARGYRRAATFSICDSFTVVHSFKPQSQHFPLFCLPPFTPCFRFAWVSQVRKLALGVSAELDEMSLHVHVRWRYSQPGRCGICHTSSSAGRNRSPQRRRLTCTHLRQREMNRFPRSDLNLTDPCCTDGSCADWSHHQEEWERRKTPQNSAWLRKDST